MAALPCKNWPQYFQRSQSGSTKSAYDANPGITGGNCTVRHRADRLPSFQRPIWCVPANRPGCLLGIGLILRDIKLPNYLLVIDHISSPYRITPDTAARSSGSCRCRVKSVQAVDLPNPYPGYCHATGVDSRVGMTSHKQL